MHVLILCGGHGTRLAGLNGDSPKPMIPIGGKPILWHILKGFAHWGFKDFVLCLGYRGSMIKEHFLNYEAMNSDFTIHVGARESITYHRNHDESKFRVTLADTGLESMTGARIKRIEKYIDTDTFMVSYGDGLADVDIRALVDFHRRHGRLATVTIVRPISRFGVLDLDPSGAVVRFAEKPQLDGWINSGFFVFNRGVFDYLSDDSSCVLEREPMEKLAKGGDLVGYRHEGFFYAMDTYREYKFLNEQWESGRAPWKVWD